MHLPIEPQSSCARTWLAATSALDGMPDRAFHNVLMTVTDPCRCDDSDTRIIELVDAHLSQHDKYRTNTVANTIFPEALYRAFGVPAFYDTYLKQICSRRAQKGWGRYFERMISHPSSDQLNPLQALIEKLRRESNRKGGVCNAYELAVAESQLEISIYDPIRDAKAIIGGQCLSFLSFHIGPDRRLLLTAIYRNHYYLARLLGNLIGLGRLLRFVSEQSGLVAGDLTVLSTHAQIDSVGSRNEIAALIDACNSASNAHLARPIEGQPLVEGVS